ncbi:MAG: DNA repair protein RecO [Dehalococcoidia bacterium]|nr:DNA repair protein RecO [Dehalococcoidia bacterium]MDW8120552.1 DNA repair protein RecO [Chloroflexota bacterium]
MGNPRLTQVQAIILKDREVGEADRLVCLFTLERGKVWARAAGVRKPTSRLGGHLQPLCHSRVLLARGRERDVVSQAEALHTFPGLRGDLRRLAQALACAEVVEGLTAEEQANPRIYHLLLHTLEGLEAGEGEVLLRWYEVQMLDALGVVPHLFACAECGAPLFPQPQYTFRVPVGVVCGGCTSHGGAFLSLSLEGLKVLRWLARHDYAQVRTLRLGPVGAEVERLLRETFRWHLEREVRAAAFGERVGGYPPVGGRAF